MDEIRIERFRLKCFIGVSDRERRTRTPIALTIRLHLDLRRAGCSDELSDTVDYALLMKRVKGESENGCCRLLEALAEHISAICLAERLVKAVDVRVEKRGTIAAPVAVEIHRSRPRGSDHWKGRSRNGRSQEGAGE